ncbi:MAG: 50S ribosomal protein L22 [Candidatus Doudnabacteria bacterium]|nr:50S ribosomal protein L22 [Candidatus Doudnabacteria bacterium]
MAEKTITTEKKLVKASARFIQVSPQKMRLVADMVRNAAVDSALEQLRFSSKKAALPLAKLINSAVANAQHNFNLDKNRLYIKTLTVDGGPVLDRFRPRAYGSPSAIHKRTSHINIILEERKGAPKKTSRSIFAGIRPGKSARTQEHKHDHEAEEAKGTVEAEKKVNRGPAPKPEEKRKGNKISLKRRLFNRKSGE